MGSLADEVLPLVRTRADLHRWGAANDYGHRVHQAVELLRQAAAGLPAAEVLDVTQRAMASALRAIGRADDSSGLIGDAIKDLLVLHAELANTAPPPPARLVKWMIDFQFNGVVDFFTIDPAAYAPALGERGMSLYRAELAEIRDRIGPEPTPEQEQARWRQRLADPTAWEQDADDRHARFTFGWNQRRLAVWDRDIEAIIATHARDRKVAAWLDDTAEALTEIGQFDLAIDWARQATFFNLGHQSVAAARRWCALLAAHHPEQELPARLEVFHRWPTATHAAAIHRAAGDTWPGYRDAVTTLLNTRPAQAVSFALVLSLS